MKEFLEERVECCKVQSTQWLKRIESTHKDDIQSLTYNRNQLCNWEARKIEVKLVLSHYNKLNP